MQAELEHIKNCFDIAIITLAQRILQETLTEVTWRWTTARATKITMISALARGKDTSYRSLSGANVWRLTVTHCTTSPSTRYKTTGIQQPSNIHYLTYGLNLTGRLPRGAETQARAGFALILNLSYIWCTTLLLDDELMWIELKCFHIYTVLK